MLQRSGDALYSNCANDKPRTCSATICVVISKCTRRCSRSSLVMGAANRRPAKRKTLRARIVQSRGIYLGSLFIVKSMVVGTFSEYILRRTEDWKVITRRKRKENARIAASVSSHLSFILSIVPQQKRSFSRRFVEPS